MVACFQIESLKVVAGKESHIAFYDIALGVSLFPTYVFIQIDPKDTSNFKSRENRLHLWMDVLGNILTDERPSDTQRCGGLRFYFLRPEQRIHRIFKRQCRASGYKSAQVMVL
jgi:hypothetical protein